MPTDSSIEILRLVATEEHRIEFATNLPMGTRGIFERDGVVWIARRADRDQAMFSILDRYAGIFKRINDDLITWINQRPGDAQLVAKVLELITGAEELRRNLMEEKAKVATS